MGQGGLSITVFCWSAELIGSAVSEPGNTEALLSGTMVSKTVWSRFLLHCVVFRHYSWWVWAVCDLRRLGIRQWRVLKTFYVVNMCNITMSKQWVLIS